MIDFYQKIEFEDATSNNIICNMMRYESPAKRPRMIGMEIDNNPKEIVPMIHQAVTASQRFEILHRLFRMIKYDVITRSCHSDPQVFMILIESGVVHALSLQLGFVLNRHGSSREEIELICTAIDIFYRFCPKLVSEESLRASGRETVRLLSVSLQRGAILPVLSIWHSCSSSELGTSLLIEERSFLKSLSETFKNGMLNNDTLLEMLGLLKNITYYGEDFRQQLIEQHGMLSAILGLAENKLSEKSQERMSAVIRNLALSSSTRVILAQRADVLTCIIRLANSATQQTLRNLLNTMVSLTMDADSCLLMVFHGDGMLIELLKRFLFYEHDPTIRKRAARTLRLMARETSVPLLIHDSKLMEMLSNRALHDVCSEVRAEAAEAFARCAGLVKAAMAQHDAVLEALTHLANSPHVPPDVMARAVMEQARYPENRAPLAKREKLLEALSNIALSPDASSAAKENVCSTFLNLSTDEFSQGKIINQLTLTALVCNAEDKNDRHSNIRETAVRTLLNLSTPPSNRNIMAKQARLIQSLLQFASTTTDDELKKEVKLVLLKLTAEL